MKEWTIEVKDTGESIILVCGKLQVIEKYNPPTGQSLVNMDREEAIGAAFASMMDHFEEES